jgi:hypothetical protein
MRQMVRDGKVRITLGFYTARCENLSLTFYRRVGLSHAGTVTRSFIRIGLARRWCLTRQCAAAEPEYMHREDLLVANQMFRS